MVARWPKLASLTCLTPKVGSLPPAPFEDIELIFLALLSAYGPLETTFASFESPSVEEVVVSSTLQFCCCIETNFTSNFYNIRPARPIREKRSQAEHDSRKVLRASRAPPSKSFGKTKVRPLNKKLGLIIM